VRGRARVVEGEGTPQTQRTRPWGRVLRVWVVVGERKGEGHPRREEHDPGVVFFVSGVVKGEGTPQGSRSLCLGGKGSGKGRGRCWKGWGAAEGGWGLALVGRSWVLDVFGGYELLGVELKSVK